MKGYAAGLLLLVTTVLVGQTGRYPFSDRNSYTPTPLEGTWYFLPEKTAQGLIPGFIPDFQESIAVALPHRVNMPDQALWYQTNVVLPDSATRMAISADDGAQVWLNAQMLLRDQFGHFILPGQRNRVNNLQIRVLNNALEGGLRSITLLTPKARKPPVHFSFWGDSQGGWPVFRQLAAQMQRYPDHFSIGLGDLVGNGIDREQWIDFEKILYALSADREVFLIPGNHDYDGYYQDLVSNHYRQLVQLQPGQTTWYSFSRGNAIFLMLDPNGNFPLSIDSLQQQWAMEVLSSEAWQRADWRFVALHQFPYGQGWEGHEGDLFLRDWIASLAEKYRIDFVLGGHNHDYERLSKNYGQQATHFILSGGAGGGLEAPPNNPQPQMDNILKVHHFCRMILHDNKAELLVYDLNGHIIDQVTFTK